MTLLETRLMSLVVHTMVRRNLLFVGVVEIPASVLMSRNSVCGKGCLKGVGKSFHES